MVEWRVALSLDESNVKGQLQTLTQSIDEAFKKSSQNLNLDKKVAEATVQANNFKKAMEAATTDRGVSFSKLTSELVKMGTSADKVKQALVEGGENFNASLQVVNNTLSTANRNVNVINDKFKEMARVFSQSFKYTAAQATFNFIRTQINDAIRYTKELDQSLTQISLITGKTADQMDRVYDSIVKGANELKVAAKDYVEATEIFYQQGLDDAEVSRRTEITVKAAKTAGQSVSTMSDQLTAIWNTYRMADDQMAAAASKAAMLGAETAIQFKDIAEAMQISASSAAQMGVSYDSLGAIIATVGETTRQSASIIGTAYKTIFARFEQLKVDGTDGEVVLKDISNQLDALGVHVLNAAGELKPLDEVIQYTGEHWEQWSQKQQMAIAQLVGGTRQYGQFLALMNNFDKYQTNLAKSQNETGGTLDTQYEAYQQGVEAAQVRMQESWHQAFSQIFTPDALKDFYDALEKIGDVLGKIIQNAGGLKGVFGQVASLLMPMIGDKAIAQFRTAAEIMKSARNDYTTGFEVKPGLSDAANDDRKQMYREVAIEAERLNKIIMEGSEGEKIVAKEQLERLQQAANHYDDMVSEVDKQNQALQAQDEKVKTLIGDEKQLAEITKTVSDPYAGNENVKYDMRSKKRNIRSINGERVDRNKSGELTKSGQAVMDKAAANTAKAHAEAEKELTEAVNNSNIAQSEKDALLTKINNHDTTYLQDIAKINSALTQENAAIEHQNAVNELGIKINNSSRSANTELINQIEQTCAGMSDRLGISGMTINSLEDEEAVIEHITAALYEDEGAWTDDEKAILENTEARAKNIEIIKGVEKDLGNAKKLTMEDSMQIAQASVRAVSAINSIATSIGGLTDSISNGTADVGTFVQAILTIAPAALMLGSTIIGILRATGNEAILTQLKFGWIGAIMAALVALVAVVKLAADAAEKASPEGKLRSAEEAAKQAASAANELADAYENVKSSIEALETKKTAIDDMKEGTLEWREAIMESNAELLKLIDAYNLVRGEQGDKNADYFVDENGMYQLTDQGKKKATETAAQRATDAQNASLGTQIGVKQAQSTAAAANAVQGITYDIGDGTIANLSGNLGASVGMAIAEALNNGVDVQSEEDLSAAIRENTNFTSYQADQIAKQITSSTDLQQSLIDLGVKVDHNSEMSQLMGEEIVKSEFSDKIAGSGLSDQQAEGLTKAMGKEVADLEEKYYNEYKDGGSKGMTDKTAQQAYAEAMGYKWVKNNTGNKGTYQKTNEDGTLSEEFQIDDETARRFLAHQAALEELGESSEQYFSAVNDLVAKTSTFEEPIRDAMQSMIGGDGAKLSDLTKEELEAFKEQFDQMEITDEMAKHLGYDSAEQMATVINDGFNDAMKGLSPEELTKNLSKTPKAAAEELLNSFGDSLTGDTGKEIASKMGEIYTKSGAEAMNVYSDFIENFDGDKDQLVDALSGIDFASANLREQLEGVNAVMDEPVSDGTLDAFAEKMLAATGAVKQFDAVEFEGKMKTFNKSIKGLKQGSIIDDEKYQGIYDVLGKEADQYFQTMADGTHKLIGTSEQFEKATQKVLTKELDEGLAANEKQYSDIAAKQAASQKALDDRNMSIANVSSVKFDKTQFTDEAGQFGGIDKSSEAIAQRVAQYALIQSTGVATDDELDSILYTVNNADATAEEAQKAMELLREKVNLAVAAYNGYDAQLAETDEAQVEIYEHALGSAKTYEQLAQLQADYGDRIKENTAAEQAEQNALNGLATTQIQAADSLATLNTARQTALEQGAASTIVDNNYQNALLGLAGQYSTCADEVRNYELAMANSNLEVRQAAENELKYSIQTAETAKALELNVDDLEDQAAAYMEAAGAGKLSRQEALKMATLNQSMNKGVTSLAKNWSDYSKKLKENDKTSMDYIDTVQAMQEDLKDLLGVTDDLEIPVGFIDSEENLALMERAAKGDVEAIDALGSSLAKAQFEALEFNAGIAAANDIDLSAFETAKEALLAGLDDIAAMSPGEAISGDWIDALNTMAETTGMSVAEMNSYLNELGVSADVTTTEVKMPRKIPITETTTTVVDPGDKETGDGRVVKTSSRVVGFDTADEMVQVAQINTGDDAGTAPIVTKASRGTPSTSAKKGGNSGKSSAPKQHTDIKERYRDTKNQIKIASDAASKYATAAGNAFGGAKIALLHKNNQEIAKLAQNYQNLAKEAREYLKADQKSVWENSALKDFDAKHGTNYAEELKKLVSFDSNGNIANLEVIQEWWDEIGKSLEGDDEALEAFNTMLKQQTDIYGKIEEAVNEYQGAVDSALNSLRDYIAAEIEAMDYKLELGIKINNQDLKRVQLTLKALGDEGSRGINKFTAALVEFNTSIDNAKATKDVVNDMIDILDSGSLGDKNGAWFIKNFGGEAWRQYKETGELSSTILENLSGQLDELLDYKDKLIDDYTKVWGVWREALQDYIDDFDKLFNNYDVALLKIEAWTNLITTTNIQLDKATKLSTMGAQVAAKKGIVTSKATLRDTLAQQRIEAEKAYTEALASEDAIRIQETKKNLDAVTEAYDTAYTDVINATADYYQTIKDLASDYYSYLEETSMRAAGYTSVGAMSSAYDDHRADEDWYLDVVNKNYGLATLIRDINDQTAQMTNSSRLKEYNAFLDKVKAAKEVNVTLTQQELDIMNAEFDVMKARDAYEEAQNSKNTMRLVRDASGNYSYQYSNDASKTQDALQQYEDAQNKLYNLQKQYQQQSEEGWIATYEAYRQYCAEVDQTRYVSDEKYRAEVLAKYDWYEEQLNRYTNQIISADAMLGQDFKDTSLGIILTTNDMKAANEKFTTAVRNDTQEVHTYTTNQIDDYNQLATQVGIDSQQMSGDVTSAMLEIQTSMQTTGTKVKELQTTMSTQMDTISRNIAEKAQSIVNSYNSIIDAIDRATRAISNAELDALENGVGGSGQYQDGWFQDSSGKWHYGQDGQIAANGWHELEWQGKKSWYYFDESGTMQSGGYAEGYQLDASGAYTGQTNGNAKADWTRGNFVESNIPKPNEGPGSSQQTGWVQRDGYWYYLQDGKPYKNGWAELPWSKGTDWFYFDSQGRCAMNTTVDGGYHVGPEGAWDKTSKGNGNWKKATYDTGGFTGTTPGPRPAILHEKELVLNAEDTANILAAVNGIRQIVNGQLGRKALDIITGTASATGAANHMTIDQKVQIDATFPNVSVSAEIEDAFTNLVNRAAQYNLK